MFSGLHFYLSTEVPRESLEYVILALGGTVTFQFEENNQNITHVITDRENLNVPNMKTKEYVQPQWVYDSVNFNKLLNVKEYWHNVKELPPHISPFLDEKDTERYIPQREKELREMQQQQTQEIEEEQVQEDKYDIVAEKKNQIKQQKKEQKEFAQISKNIITNKNKKLLKVIEHGQNQRKEAREKLEQKAKVAKKR